MARLRAPEGLRVERYYRGAVVELTGRVFALPESVVRCIEAVRQPTADANVELDLGLVERLIELGILEWSEQ
ncbi:MAG: hypothetical protein ABI895_19175 [Deltaproteobacteria bacterium]